MHNTLLSGEGPARNIEESPKMAPTILNILNRFPKRASEMTKRNISRVSWRTSEHFSRLFRKFHNLRRL